MSGAAKNSPVQQDAEAQPRPGTDAAGSQDPLRFVHPIRVTWGDCDPANIAYTARIPWFALDAINAWWEDCIGEGWYQLENDRGVGTPFVHLSMDFRAPITPRHRLLCDVRPVRLGTTSIAFEVAGHQDGTLCFTGQFVCVFVVAGGLSKAPPPEDLRRKIQPWIDQDNDGAR